METGNKQTLIVEVMPLVGGHLALPKVRLSKYILPSEECTDHSPAESSSHIPRLEPFAPGQVYNLTRTAKIHVLPAPTANEHRTGPHNSIISIASSQDSIKTTSLPFSY